MCASFLYKKNIESLSRYLGQPVKVAPSAIEENETITYPFKPAYVLQRKGPDIFLSESRYSLTPSWSKDEKPKFATYNARLTRTHQASGKLEKIFEVPTWKEAFGKKNCVVPMNEFFESCREGEAAGHMVGFSPRTESPLLVAGIWNDWVNKSTGEVLSTFAVITTDPTAQIKFVGHDRSPVILDPATASTWLDGFSSGAQAFDFLNSSLVRPELDFRKVRPLKALKPQV